MFDRVNGFIRGYNGTKYLGLFGPGKYDAIFDRIRYLIGFKGGSIYVFSHNYAKTKIDSDDDFPLQNTLALQNIVIHIKSFSNKKNFMVQKNNKDLGCPC